MTSPNPTRLDRRVLSVLLVGSTHYVDIGKKKDAAIYYRDDQQVHMALPDGATMRGEWSLREEGYFVRWHDGPEGHWHLESIPGEISYIDPSGRRAGTVTRIVPGNAEGFPNAS